MPARRPQKGPVTGPANGTRAGRSPHYLTQWAGRGAGRAAFLATGPSSWYDARDLLSTSQTTLPNRVGTGTATLTNGVVALPGSGYVYLPGTASNNLSVTKGAWGGTLHVTATKTDNTTATFTTTADPVLIGNTLLAAGSYKRFDVRENDANGAIHTTINLQTETLGQTSWACTTGQTVTVNRSTSGLATAVVTRPILLLDGSDDYVQLPAGDTPHVTNSTGSFSMLVLTRSFTSHTGIVLSTDVTQDTGIAAYVHTDLSWHTRVGAFGQGESTRAPGAGTVFNGTLRALGMVVTPGSPSTSKAYERQAGFGTAANITANPVTHNPPRVGTRAYNTSLPLKGEVASIVLYNGAALAAASMNTASDYLLGSYA